MYLDAIDVVLCVGEWLEEELIGLDGEGAVSGGDAHTTQLDVVAGHTGPTDIGPLLKRDSTRLALHNEDVMNSTERSFIKN